MPKSHRSVCFFVATLLLLLLVGGCAKKKKVATPKAPRIGQKENGIASWYGIPYHGRRAANGEIYDMEKLTAAHRTLPFDTWVRVHDLDNGKKIDVRITDRGPFIRGRIIDLSKAAARDIDMLRSGPREGTHRSDSSSRASRRIEPVWCSGGRLSGQGQR